MRNPEVIDKKTPNGGDYSEMWYLDKDGNPAKSLDAAKSLVIHECTRDGKIIQTTYGEIERG